MPSQSRLDGESTPDHWIRIGSPDLERILGEMDREGPDCVDGSRRERRKTMRRGIMVAVEVEVVETGGFVGRTGGVRGFRLAWKGWWGEFRIISDKLMTDKQPKLGICFRHILINRACDTSTIRNVNPRDVYSPSQVYLNGCRFSICKHQPKDKRPRRRPATGHSQAEPRARPRIAGSGEANLGLARRRLTRPRAPDLVSSPRLVSLSSP